MFAPVGITISAANTLQTMMHNKEGEKPEENSKLPAETVENDSDDSDAERASDGDDVADNDDRGQSRRAKRLLLNRESARARRKRKKALLQTLEQQVVALSKQNQVYRVVNESLTGQVQRLESDLAVANSTIVMLRSGGGSGNTGSHMLPGGGLSNHSDAIQRLLASQPRGLFSTHMAATGPDHGLLSGGADLLLQRQQLQAQLSQVNMDSVLANLLQQQQQQPSLTLSPRLHRQQIALNQVSKVSRQIGPNERSKRSGAHMIPARPAHIMSSFLTAPPPPSGHTGICCRRGQTKRRPA